MPGVPEADESYLSTMGEDLLSEDEQRRLSDENLVALIEERSNLRGDAAREALAIIRCEIPVDEIF